jgi:hypothetical protein
MELRAAFVGINAYAGSPLYNCVNDVDDIAKMLAQGWAYPMRNIRVCPDKRATRRAIIERLQWVAGYDSSDPVTGVFYYSGHGTQFVGATAAQEADGYNEALCPVDLDWSSDGLVLDYQIDEILARGNPKSRFYLFFDSCFSGGLDRLVKPGAAPKRFLAPPQGLTGRPRKIVAPHEIEATAGNVLKISACREDQTCSDGSPWDTIAHGHGAFTGALRQCLSRLPTKAIREWIDWVNSTLALNGYEQVAVISGNKAMADEPLPAGDG